MALYQPFTLAVLYLSRTLSLKQGHFNYEYNTAYVWVFIISWHRVSVEKENAQNVCSYVIPLEAFVDGDKEAECFGYLTDGLMHLSMVRKYLEENFTEYNSYYDIEDMIEKNALVNRTQSKITDFFK